MSDILDDKAYIEELRGRISDQRKEIARLMAEKAEALRDFALRLQTKTDSYEEIYKQQREKIERLQTIGQDLHRKETEAAQRLYEERLWSNEARALLERLANIGEVPPVTGDLPGIIRDTRAFLAQ